MNVSLFIAKKYFFSKERKSFINIVAILSVLILLASTAAMVIVLSVFNGFSTQLKSIHKSFEPELTIFPSSGKTFERTDALIQKIEQTEGVSVITEVIEDDVYLSNNEYSKLARFKGVSSNYLEQNGIEEALIRGKAQFDSASLDQAVLGYGILYSMDISLNNEFKPLELMYPKRKRVLRNHSSLNRIGCVPIGVFQIERQYDERFIFIPLRTAELLTNNEGRRSGIEVKTSEEYTPERVKKLLQSALGDDFKIQLVAERHVSLYRAIKIEKLIALLVLIIIMAVASINLYIIVSMMIVSKKKDIAILYALGATRKFVKRIFFLESFLISLLGVVSGLLIGFVICYLQDLTGFIRMGVDSSLLDSFPVEMQLSDFVSVASITMVISVLTFINPIRRIRKLPLNFRL